MSALSNFGPQSDASRIVCRLAGRHEIDPALRLLLAGPDGYAGDEQVQGFIDVANQRGLDLSDTWVAIDGRRIAWALLPVVSPGKTMLILSPPKLAAMYSPNAVPQLLGAVCEEYKRRGIDLAQMLIDPAEAMLRRVYVQQGFAELAELIYLQRGVRRVVAVPPLSEGIRFVTYSPQTHDLFAQTIGQTYEHSLDCPALNGLRAMEDVIAGHKASGEFDPALWYVLTENAVPRGVLLLSRTLQGDGVELVYLGLTTQARGRGLGDALMSLALVSVARQNRSELTLAVDSRNEPALKLYHRHGLRRIASRMAMIRDLRK